MWFKLAGTVGTANTMIMNGGPWISSGTATVLGSTNGSNSGKLSVYAINGASIAPKFTKNDGQIDWQKSADSIYNLYRAISHNPGVWTNFNEQRLKIDSLRVLDVEQNLKVGEVLINDESFFVGTGMGAIEILRLTPSGRNQMSASEFIRGLTKRTGLYLG